MRSRLTLFTLALGASMSMPACGQSPETLPPIGQILLYIDTDAPLPPPPGEPLRENDPAPLFDRARIEFFPPGSDTPCSDCTHEFDLDRVLVGRGKASVGIHPPFETKGYAARVRLFRAIDADVVEPRADTTIDVTIELPPIAPEGIRHVTALLLTNDVGRPIGTRAQPVPPIDGAPAGGRAGTWAPAQRRSCNGAPEPGEVCVPGGAYWMGSATPLTSDDAVARRIVSVAPFFLDATEVTVEAFRESGLATANDPFDGETKQLAYDVRFACTWRKIDRNTDAFPLNCVSWDRARAFCQWRGADLPTEAQYQYAASGLGRSRYVWGNDDASCDDAVYARIGLIHREYKCPGGQVERAGLGLRDRLVLPIGTIVDLAGNLSEHTLDVWNLEREACWGVGVFVDPVCDVDRATKHSRLRHTVVGGSFSTAQDQLQASYREEGGNYAIAMADPAPSEAAPLPFLKTGFRCARPGL